MTKSEEINQILHQHIRLVFKDAINYKELIQSLLDWQEKQLLIHGVVSSLFALIDEDNDIVMPLFLDEQKAIETRVKYLKDGLRKTITVNRVEVI